MGEWNMILQCISDYRSGFGSFKAGQQTDDLTDVDALRLMVDSPGSFRVLNAYEGLTIADLKVLAAERGINVNRLTRKDDFIDAIEQDDTTSVAS